MCLEHTKVCQTGWYNHSKPFFIIVQNQNLKISAVSVLNTIKPMKYLNQHKFLLREQELVESKAS